MRTITSSSFAIALGSAAVAGCALFSGDSSYSGYDYEPRARSPRDAGTSAPPQAPQPDFGRTVLLKDSPPPLSGGTLIVSRDGTRAVAADPDRDQVFIADLSAKKAEHVVTLEPHDEPGRVVEDRDGRFHVVLRRGGAVATISIIDGAANVERRKVCPAPRGLAFEGKDSLLVACEGGELMRLPVEQGAAALVARLERDLRDVIVTKSRVFVSTFRSARILELTHQGALITSSRIPSTEGPMKDDEPMIAFRMIAAARAPDDDDSDPIIVHEEAQPGALSTGSGGYYGAPRPSDLSPCSSGSVIRSAVSRVGVEGGTLYLPRAAVLPVDIATDGKSLAVVAAGNSHTRELPQLYMMTPSSGQWSSPCSGEAATPTVPTNHQLTAVAFRGKDAVIVQSRQPAALTLLPENEIIELSSSIREDTGHAIFHSNASVGAACASCHPEGGDDGHTWQFTDIGERRTPSLRGTLAGTAPFHWDGDIVDIAHLADDVLSGRMSGPRLDEPQKHALESWLFAIPAPNPSVFADDATVARGKVIFARKDVGCASCHSGTMMTNGGSANVGTGGSYQIPSLVGVASRAPLMHTGCASTLRDRFTIACGGAKHGQISQLTGAEIDELITYLESL